MNSWMQNNAEFYLFQFEFKFLLLLLFFFLIVDFIYILKKKINILFLWSPF